MKAPLKYEFDDVECMVYKHTDTVRVDFTKKSPKKPMCVSLKPNNFITMYHVSDMVTDAIRRKKSFTYDMGDQIYLTHEQFRSKWSVNIRQYYTDDRGDEQPGRWGVNMTQQEWSMGMQKHFKEMCKYKIIHLCNVFNVIGYGWVYSVVFVYGMILK